MFSKRLKMLSVLEDPYFQANGLRMPLLESVLTPSTQHCTCYKSMRSKMNLDWCNLPAADRQNARKKAMGPSQSRPETAAVVLVLHMDPSTFLQHKGTDRW